MDHNNNNGIDDVQTKPKFTQATSRLRAGVGVKDITTEIEGTPIHDRLRVKVLVLSDGDTTLVMVTMDALAIGGIGDIKDDFLTHLRNRIKAELAIPAQHVFVNASHTHPPGKILCSEQEQVERTIDAIRTAYENMTEVKLGVGRGFENRMSINRNLEMKDGSHWSIRVAHPTPPDDDVVGMGPIDPEIGILRIDHLDDRPFAVVYNFANHPLLGMPGRPITADYPGFASKVIEDTWGEGTTAFFLQGAAGDLIDPLYKNTNIPWDSEPRGVMLGLSVLHALKKIRTTRSVSLRVLSETIQLPRRTDIPQRIEKLREQQEQILRSMRSTSLNFKSFLPLYMEYTMDPQYPSDDKYVYWHHENIGSHAITSMDDRNKKQLESYLHNVYSMERLVRVQSDISTLKKHQAINEHAGTPTISAEVMGIKIGACVFITAPFEALVEIGMNIKKASPFEYTFMAAFSNGYMHYGAPMTYYAKGGYEVTECLLAPGWQPIYEEKALDIINRLT